MTKTEITRVLTGQKIKIDGRIRSDERFPVGHMDVVELIDENKFFRVQIHNSHRILPFEIEEDDSQFKICKVIGKRNVKGGHTQISLHDGRNILLDKDDDRIGQIKGQYSLKIALPSQEILEIYPLEEEARAMVTEGRHQGKVGKITEITRRYGPNASEVIFEDENDAEEREFRTALDYVFVVGPEIDLHTGELNE
jgi:small subunit ribosomal protein S4e